MKRERREKYISLYNIGVKPTYNIYKKCDVCGSYLKLKNLETHKKRRICAKKALLKNNTTEYIQWKTQLNFVNTELLETFYVIDHINKFNDLIKKIELLNIKYNNIMNIIDDIN